MLCTEYIATVPDLLARHDRERADRIAYIDDGRAVTYGDLALTTARLAGHLQEMGVEPGDRVLLYLDNCVAVAESYLAVPRAGAVAVCANPQAATAEVAHILSDSGARIVITDSAHLGVARELVTEHDVLAVVVLGDRDGGGRPGERAELRRSRGFGRGPGTARLPRPRRHRVDALHVRNDRPSEGRLPHPARPVLGRRGVLGTDRRSRPGRRGSQALPLFHSYALALCVLGVFAVGASARILPRFSVTDVVNCFAGGPEGDVTVFPGVPTMYHYLLDRAADQGLAAPSLRLCISAGAILPASVNERFEAAFGIPLLDGYGITETSTMVTMNWPTGSRVMGSCGLPLPGLTVRLVDPVTGHDVLQGDEGELWVQGPNVTPAYHNLPAATAAVLVDGWYRTGDLARRDENGFLRISGRTKELIIRGRTGSSRCRPCGCSRPTVTCSRRPDRSPTVGRPTQHRRWSRGRRGVPREA